jgi:hypothetical protein
MGVSNKYTDDYITSKVLKYIGVEEVGKSKVDGCVMIKAFLNEYNIQNLRRYFMLSEIYNAPFDQYKKANLNGDLTVLKIKGFSSDKWQDIVNLKRERKLKLKKLNGIRKNKK